MSTNLNFTNIRLSRELSKLQSDKLEGIIIETPTDLMIWNAKIKGPQNSPFENGIFDIQLKFNTDYPIKPPSVKFLTQMYHPNIYRDGKICIDILQSEWTPAQNIRTILISIISLLMDPNTSSPAIEMQLIYIIQILQLMNKKLKILLIYLNKLILVI